MENILNKINNMSLLGQINNVKLKKTVDKSNKKKNQSMFEKGFEKIKYIPKKQSPTNSDWD